MRSVADVTHGRIPSLQTSTLPIVARSLIYFNNKILMSALAVIRCEHDSEHCSAWSASKFFDSDGLMCYFSGFAFCTRVNVFRSSDSNYFQF